MKSVRILARQMEKELIKARALAENFKKFAQVIWVPFTLESLSKKFT